MGMATPKRARKCRGIASSAFAHGVDGRQGVGAADMQVVLCGIGTVRRLATATVRTQIDGRSPLARFLVRRYSVSREMSAVPIEPIQGRLS